MVQWTHVDRRRFLSASALVSAAGFLPNALHALAPSESKPITLRVIGDAQQGYGVSVSFRGQPIAQYVGGEMSAIFQNGERSLTDRVDHWKATSRTESKDRIELSGEMQLTNLRTTVYVQVVYELLSTRQVRKSIRLHQSDMFSLIYQLSHRLESVSPDVALWSFDQPDCAGGPLREYFPSAGFRTKGGVAVGLLTDAGFRNQWSRVIRRDGVPLKPSPTTVPDLNLYRLPTRSERIGKMPFVEQTFGEATTRRAEPQESTTVALPSPSSWNKFGKIRVLENHEAITLSSETADDYVLIPFHANAGEAFAIDLKYRSSAAIMVRAWDVDGQLKKLADLSQFNDTAPAASDFATFHQSFVVPSLQGPNAALVFSSTESTGDTAPAKSGTATSFDLKDIVLSRLTMQSEPYHVLEMGKAALKTAFVFVDDEVSHTIRGYRLASQIHLAEALGFRGGETEKVLYADLMMLCWNADLMIRRPMLAPSIWYSAAGEMYLRDSFYALNGIHNRELNEKVFALWADNQGEDGAINTLVEPEIANLERKSNDSTPLWLMWALLNRRRFGTELPMEKVKRAAEYCLAAYDPTREAVCKAKFVMGQLDVIQYPEGTSVLCENQGMLAVLLRVIRALEIPQFSASIAEDYIAKAEEGYRSYYDPAHGFMKPARDISDAIGFADIFPEFLSLWLFQRKILTDEMILSHLDRIPVMLPRKDCPYPEERGSLRPIFIGLPGGGTDWSFFNEKWHPMVSDSFAQGYAHKAADGVYYNGGSWMRIEICGYVTGKLHGWKRADRAIANRLWAETHTDSNFPTSQEYLATELHNPFFGFHRVFAWNSFVLQAMEMASLRRPEMDPDYVSRP